VKIAVSASGSSLDATVDPRFGRCPYYVIVETETMAHEVMPNDSMSAPSGAGIGAAQAVARKGVQAVITGSLGPNASQVLSASGIKMITGARGTVRQAVDDFRGGRLSPSQTPSYAGGFGMGRGMGMGRGKGRGMGRGMGMGGAGRGLYTYDPQFQPPYPTTAPTGLSRDQEREQLREQIKSLERQLEDIKKRMEELK
jgi:predicted Fe-Mo cluster-binding NifX family protein